MDIKLNLEDKEWLKTKHPGLKFNSDKNIARGEFIFDRTYREIRIVDSYLLHIEFITKEGSILPQVKEIDGKIEHIAKKLSLPPIDLHINETDKTLCLCIDVRERDYLPDGFAIKVFFERILEPFFYWVSYYGKYKKPPWGEYAHGDWGYLELYAEGYISIGMLKKNFSVEKLQELKKQKGHNKCSCGSNKKLRDCHRLVYNAIYKLKKELYG